MKLKFHGESRGPYIVEKYRELRQVHGVRYPAEDYQPIIGEKSVDGTWNVIITSVNFVYLSAIRIIINRVNNQPPFFVKQANINQHRATAHNTGPITA